MADYADPALDPEALLRRAGKAQIAYLEWQRKWLAIARDNQIPPEEGWTEFGVQAGRGFGKSRVGAEWLGRTAFECPNGFPHAVVAPTQADVRFVCMEGESGLLNVIPPECVASYNRSDLLLTLTNGAAIRGFSAEKADRLRGPQNASLWFDELAAWGKDAEDTWDMAMFGLRLGEHPRVLWTSTPRPTSFIRKLTAPKEGRIIVRGTTFDNKANLPDSFFRQIEQYEGTKIGRQELYGELIDPEEAGIVRRSWFRLWPANKPLPDFDWIIMSLDTAYTEKTLDTKGDPDPTACSVWGVFKHKDKPTSIPKTHLIVLDCWEDHLGLPELMRRVRREMEARYGDDEDTAVIRPLVGSGKPSHSGRKPDILLIEDIGSGMSLRQMLADSGIEAYAYNPGRADKLSRLHIVSPVFAQRRVWLPESERYPGRAKTWTEGLISQLCSYAGEGSIRHDDLLDSATQAVRLCLDKGFIDLLRERDRDKLEEDRGSSEPRKPAPLIATNPYAV